MSSIKVATLNFSGINVSPFQYHDGSDQKLQLDCIFKRLLDEEKTKNSDGNWNIAKIDKFYSQERYSILYRSDCGYVRGRLLNKDQFDVVWDLTFDLNQGIVGHMNIEDQLIDRLRTFDWLAYNAFVSLIFDNPDMNNPSKLCVAKYKEQLKKWHNKNYLNINKKIDYVREYILENEIDVMFLQEALNKRCSDYLPNSDYNFVKNADSLIIYKKDFCFQDKSDLDAFDAKYKSKLDFNKDSVYLKSQNVLLMSVHLSSKSVNVEQAHKMFETLQQIQNDYKDIVIIIGTDANHYLANEGNFKVFPDYCTPTTRKKRTYMQCQFQKAGKLIQQTKDHIITNQMVGSWNISSIKSKQIQIDLLPNDLHPYDHFLISATIKLDKTNLKRQQSSNISSTLLRFGSMDSQTSMKKNYIAIQDLIGRIVPPQQPRYPFRRTLTSFSTQNKPMDLLRCMNSTNYDITQFHRIDSNLI